MRAALKRHDAILANAVRVTGGLIFKHTGDGILASMPSVGAAASSALDAQAALRGADWSPFDSLPVRMAIHAGDVESRGDDWFGPGLNLVHGDSLEAVVGMAESLAIFSAAGVAFAPAG